ncbi:sulfurtransferase [Robertkochia solimangrovi]|uniref:sulfurtransferase n=1 Tax=Robertkochia solimangrovi TaxID=2213046 RepID=UPI001F557D36|nr:sulfurtransferase [Robertkochia solimangrovi]
MEPIVSVAWLSAHIDDDDLILLDVSSEMTAVGERSAFDGVSIRGARKIDLQKDFSDLNSAFPNTFPALEFFEQTCCRLGIRNNSRIVIFDNLGIYTSPRLWWLFKAMGHEEVTVLDGGLPEWIRNGFGTFEVSSGSTYEPGAYSASIQPGYLVLYEEVIENLQSGKFVIADARSAARFSGSGPEPRKDLQSGMIPGSLNIPFKEVLSDGVFKSKAELVEIFTVILNTHKTPVFSCGSGVTACILMMAWEIAFGPARRIYDGSWTEWATLNDLTF